MGSSPRAGLATLADTCSAATVVILVDMPGVTAAAVRRVAVGAGRAEMVMAGDDKRCWPYSAAQPLPGEELRYHHPPRLRYQLGHLVGVESGEMTAHPVEPQVGRAG